jgi:hypothetical protein
MAGVIIGWGVALAVHLAGRWAARRAVRRDGTEPAPLRKRAAVLAGGVGASYVFSALLFALVALLWGMPAPGTGAFVAQTADGKPARRPGCVRATRSCR